MAANPQNDGRPAAGHKGRPESERNDQGAVARQRPAVAGDGGPAEQGGQQPEGDTATKAGQPDPHGELPVLRRIVDRGFGHSGHRTESRAFVLLRSGHRTRYEGREREGGRVGDGSLGPLSVSPTV